MRLVLAVVVMGMWVNACARREAPQANARAAAERAVEQEGWSSQVVSTKDGRPTAIIAYGHMLKYKNDQLYRFNQGVQVDLYDEHGVHLSRVTADSGVMHEATYDLEAHGNVVVVSDTGIVLRTERLFYNKTNDKVYSDAPVTIIHGPGDTLYGKGFESDKTLSNYVFYQPRGVSQRTIDLNLERRLQPPPARRDSLAAPGVAGSGPQR